MVAGTIVHVPFRNVYGEVLENLGEYLTIYYPTLGFSEQLKTSMVNLGITEMAEGGETKGGGLKDWNEDIVRQQKEAEAGVKFPKYRIIYYADVGTKAKPNYTRIGDIDKSDSFPVILRKGLDFIEMNKSRYPVVQVKIDRFVPVEERGNPVYPYDSIMIFNDRDVKGGLLKLELGGLSTISPSDSVFLDYENSVAESLINLLGIDRGDAEGIMLSEKVENIIVNGFIDKLQPSVVASKIDEATRLPYYGRGGATPIDSQAIGEKSRDQDFDQTMALLRRDKVVFWSWGVSKVEVSHRERYLRLRVNGRYLNGWVYIFLNGADLYDVYFTSNRNNLRDSVKDVFAGDLVFVIDSRVESDPNFKYEFKIGGVTMGRGRMADSLDSKEFALSSRYAEYMRTDEVISVVKDKGWDIDFLGGSRIDHRQQTNFVKPVVLQISFEISKPNYDINDVKRLKNAIEERLEKDVAMGTPRLAFKDSEVMVSLKEIDSDRVDLMVEVVPGFAKGGKTITSEEWAKIKPHNKHIGRDGQPYLMKLDEARGTYLMPVTVTNEKGMAVGGLNVSQDLRERAAIHYLSNYYIDRPLYVFQDGTMSDNYDVDKTVFTLNRMDDAQAILRTHNTLFDLPDLKEVNENAYQEVVNDLGDNLTMDDFWYEHVKEDLNNIGLELVSFDLPSRVELAFIDDWGDVINAIITEHGKTTRTYKLAEDYDDEWAELNSVWATLDMQLYEADSEEEEKKLEEEIDVIQESKKTIENDFLEAMELEYAKILNDAYEAMYEEDYIEDYAEANELRFNYDGDRQ